MKNKKISISLHLYYLIKIPYETIVLCMDTNLFILKKVISLIFCRENSGLTTTCLLHNHVDLGKLSEVARTALGGANSEDKDST